VRRLESEGSLRSGGHLRLLRAADTLVAEAIAFADAVPFPALSEATSDVF
jgi:hypothetical protein